MILIFSYLKYIDKLQRGGSCIQMS